MNALYTSLVATLAVSAMAITANGHNTLIGAVVGMGMAILFGTMTFLKIAVVVIMIGVATDLGLHVSTAGDDFPPHVVILCMVAASLIMAKVRGVV